MVSYILITRYSIVIYEPIEFRCCYFEMLLVNLLAALNFANVFEK